LLFNLSVISRHGGWRWPFNSFRKKRLAAALFRRFLHKNINGVFVLVDGSPKIMQVAVELDEDLVEIPGIT